MLRYIKLLLFCLLEKIAVNGFRPSLFYLIYNYRLISPVRLLAALHYQHEQDWKNCPPFIAILEEYCGFEPRMLHQLKERHGDLEMEPLPQLLLDSRRINQYQYFKLLGLNYYFPSHYLGRILIEQEFINEQSLTNFLESGPIGFNLYAPSRTPMQQKQALMLLYERLYMREYLSREEIQALGIHRLETLPVSFKPLVDVLIAKGDLPVDVLAILLKQDVPREQDPLLPLLACSGFSTQSLTAGMRKRPDVDLILACELVEKGLISPHRLSEAVLNAYRSAMPEITTQSDIA